MLLSIREDGFGRRVYQHEQREQAGRVAELLRASAYDVGWDRKLGSGDDFQLTISKELAAAARVVVL